jgi:cbb3-type cytochrome oxidase maturation protein
MSGIMGFLFLLSGIFVLLIIVGVFWSIKSGQFDDLEGPAERILMDDDDPLLPGRRLPGKDEQP